jgi:hypothetical protein
VKRTKVIEVPVSLVLMFKNTEWGDSDRLTYHNPQTKEAKVIIGPSQGLKSVISGWFLYSKDVLRANILITQKKRE